MTDNHDDDRDDNIDRNDHMPADDDVDYDVGYRKPPKASQFPPGQSGNPRGRKKGSRGIKTDFGAELKSKLSITENGKTISISRQQVVLKALVTKAAKGDIKAAALVVSMIMQMFGVEDPTSGKSELSAKDAALLDSFLEHQASLDSMNDDGSELEADAGGAGNRDGNRDGTVQSDDERSGKEDPDNGDSD